MAEHFPQPLTLGQEERLPFPTGFLARSNQPCREDFRVVQDKQVAGREQVRQVAEDAVFDRG